MDFIVLIKTALTYKVWAEIYLRATYSVHYINSISLKIVVYTAVLFLSHNGYTVINRNKNYFQIFGEIIGFGIP